ncbi:hypothetical protein [Streptomyces sp. NPDC050759]|uniref:hypothetical protein n=1 Tax=Streptomyces sp. NPDC050759 TaxID=3365635 RepID=UPI00378767AA
MLPPLQTCDKGNACLTCSVFVTDNSHQPARERQLAETSALIDRFTAAFQERHGRPMPEDNVWLVASKAHLIHVGVLSGRPPGPVSDELYAGRVKAPSRGFLWPFGLSAFASWIILLPPGSSALLAVGLPSLGLDLDGVSTFHSD